MKQNPKILKSHLTDSYYLVTSYEVLGNGQYRAKRKIDITEQIQEALAAEYQKGHNAGYRLGYEEATKEAKAQE